MTVLNLSVVALATETLGVWGKTQDHGTCTQKPIGRQYCTQVQGHIRLWFLPRYPRIRLWKEEEAFATQVVHCKALTFEEETTCFPAANTPSPPPKKQ